MTLTGPGPEGVLIKSTRRRIPRLNTNKGGHVPGNQGKLGCFRDFDEVEGYLFFGDGKRMLKLSGSLKYTKE